MTSAFSKFFAKNVSWNATVHLLIGLGAGIILSRPVFTVHPLRYGLIFLALGVLGHLYPLFSKLK